MAIQKHTRRDFIKQLGLGTVAMALPQTLEIIQGKLWAGCVDHSARD